MYKSHYPVYEPHISDDNKRKVQECLDQGWISSQGPFINEFEDKLKDYLNVEHAIAVNSGTSALETALWAAGISEGDEVILPSFTIISCAIAVLRIGAKPVFADVDLDTWNTSIQKVKEKITSSTRAILPVHIFGNPVDLDPLLDFARQNNLIVVEDAAQALGSTYKGQYAGSIGDLGCFSFYANKLITTGEGGAVVTNNPLFAKKARSYRNLCFKESRRFHHDELGYNFRMSSLQAALGASQLEAIKDKIHLKFQNEKHYHSRLHGIPGVTFQKETSFSSRVPWMHAVRLSPEVNITADEMMKNLRNEGVGTRPFFIGLHEQPALRNPPIDDKDTFPHTRSLSQYGFYLPSSLHLSEKDIDSICKKFSLIHDRLSKEKHGAP